MDGGVGAMRNPMDSIPRSDARLPAAMSRHKAAGGDRLPMAGTTRSRSSPTAAVG